MEIKNLLCTTDPYQAKIFENQKIQIRRLWNISERTAEILFLLTMLKKPEFILEIGTSNGYSTTWLSLAAEKNSGKVHTIEVDQERFNKAKLNLESRSNIIQFFGKAEEIIPNLSNNYDLLFIDAGKINYIDYIKLAEQKLNNNALVIADNTISHSHTVESYLKYIRNSKNYFSLELGIDDGLELSIYKKEEV